MLRRTVQFPFWLFELPCLRTGLPNLGMVQHPPPWVRRCWYLRTRWVNESNKFVCRHAAVGTIDVPCKHSAWWQNPGLHHQPLHKCEFSKPMNRIPPSRARRQFVHCGCLQSAGSRLLVPGCCLLICSVGSSVLHVGFRVAVCRLLAAVGESSSGS